MNLNYKISFLRIKWDEIRKLILSLAMILVIAGCSSTQRVPKELTPKPISKVVPTETLIKNNSLVEREFIHNSRILSIDKIKFNYVSRNKLGRGERYSQQKFNQNGFLTETIFYDNHGEIESRYTYEYDAQGYLSETLRYDATGKEVKKYTYEYNEYGNKIKAIRYNMDGEMEKYYIYKYDGNGNLIDDLWYDVSGKLDYKIINKYNEDRKKILSESYNGDGNLEERISYQYDRNNLIEEIRSDKDGKKIGIIQYVYKKYN